MWSTAVSGLAWRVGLALALVVAIGPVREASANPKYASIVIDYDSGMVLSAENAEAQRYPASLTKMMTLFLAFEAIRAGHLDLDQRVEISARAAAMPASKIGLRRGQRVKVRHLISVIAVRSANDAAVALAEAIAGDEAAFARQMTRRAREIGMERTSFFNASGWPDRRQVTTARDMSRLAIRLIRDFPEFYHFFGKKTVRWNGRTYRSTNNLLRTYPGVDGLKTGFINASGYNLAASARRDGRRIVAVVFGGRRAATRDRHMAQLLDRGFASNLVARHFPPALPPRRPGAGGPTVVASAGDAALGAGSLGALILPARRPDAPARMLGAETGLVAPQRSARSELELAAASSAETSVLAPVSGAEARALMAAAAAEIEARQGRDERRAAARGGADVIGPLAAAELAVDRDSVATLRPARAAAIGSSGADVVSPERDGARAAVAAAARATASSGGTTLDVAVGGGFAARPAGGSRQAVIEFAPLIGTGSPTARRWGVQVGAFVSRDQAEEAARRASARAPGPLASGRVRVSALAGVERPIYRARIVGFDRPTAERACAALTEIRLDCLVVRADAGVDLASSSG